MSNSTLNASSPLSGFTKRYGSSVVQEVFDLDIVSIATPNDGQSALQTSLQQKLGLSLPVVGKIERNNENHLLLGLQPSQCFWVATGSQLEPARTLKTLLGDSAYVSDQSDSWAVLEIIGPDAAEALARICPLDLDPQVFDENTVARTSMEHLSVIIHRSGNDGFRLYSPRSSASSFLHAVTESLYNVCSTTTG